MTPNNNDKPLPDDALFAWITGVTAVLSVVAWLVWLGSLFL